MTSLRHSSKTDSIRIVFKCDYSSLYLIKLKNMAKLFIAERKKQVRNT